MRSTRTSELTAVLAQLAELLSAPDRVTTSSEPVPRPMPSPVLLTVEETAKQLRIGKTKAQALISAGEIESVQIGRLRRVHVDAVRSYASRLVAEQNGTDDLRRRKSA